MAVTVVAHNELVAPNPESEVDLDRWQQLARQALTTEGVAAGELNLLFVDSAAMAALNEEHMDGVGPTDVLAFPIDGEMLDPDAPPQPVSVNGMPVLLGDVIVCPEVARHNAASHSVTFEDEMALLVVHGVLHVLGHDHAEVDDTARMKSREQALLGAHHKDQP